MSLEFAIFGSCVSRDALEFIQDGHCLLYVARSSIVSATSKLPGAGELDNLLIDEKAHRFHQESIEYDVRKTGLSALSSTNCPVIVDLIEERVPLGVLASGSLVTLSQAAGAYSNLKSLVKRVVQPFSDEHIELFAASLEQVAETLRGKKVLVHKSMYAEDGEKRRENVVLERMYGLLINALQATIIEPDFAISSTTHKWGLAPYHYVDSYYKSFVAKLAIATRQTINCKPGFTMQKA